jgi:putative transport protein
MSFITRVLTTNPELAIFLTLAAGFWLGSLKIGKFSLGIVTSTLLAGVVIGQLQIDVSPQLKSIFFLMFLFAVGYGVGPQFFSALKQDGLQHVLLAVVLCLLCLLVTYVVAKVLGYNLGQAAGLLAGASTISAVVGVASDTLNSLPLPPEQKAAFVAVMPVAYAVTYIYGTIGSAWILARLGPRLLGIDLAEESRKYEEQSGQAASSTGGISAYRSLIVRAYRVSTRAFEGKTVREFERHFEGHRLYVARIRRGEKVYPAEPDSRLETDAIIAVGGRRDALLAAATELGPEIDDRVLLDFPGDMLDVVVTRSEAVGKSLGELADDESSRDLFLRKLERAGREMPFSRASRLKRGDVLQIVGPPSAVARAAKWLGYGDRATEKTDMLFMGLGIVAGGLVGAMTFRVGGVPLSLSTSGGALIAGLVCGWLRSVHRTFGRIPAPALWVFNNVGLNTFIAVVGLSAGPTFVQGVKESGLSLLLAGVVVTTVPLIGALYFGRYVLKMNPAILLGALAGGRTTTAALGALEEAAKSRVPALGYTVPYAVGNTLLIIWGVVIVLLLK